MMAAVVSSMAMGIPVGTGKFVSQCLGAISFSYVFEKKS
jgi:hypothetical protein